MEAIPYRIPTMVVFKAELTTVHKDNVKFRVIPTPNERNVRPKRISKNIPAMT